MSKVEINGESVPNGDKLNGNLTSSLEQTNGKAMPSPKGCVTGNSAPRPEIDM